MLHVPAIFDFVVIGIPVSNNSGNTRKRRAWKGAVYNAATSFWPAGQAPFNIKLSVHILYIHGPLVLDVDNVPKIMLDAIKSLVYLDDQQIDHLEIERRSLNDPISVSTVNPALLNAIYNGEEFLHLTVSAYP